MIQPLTEAERAELNAWIAVNVFGWKPTPDMPGYGRSIKKALSLIGEPYPDYAGEWSAAGPLFDRYEFELDRYINPMQDNAVEYRCYKGGDYEALAQGTTGPEAIAKAVRAYEEGKRG